MTALNDAARALFSDVARALSVTGYEIEQTMALEVYVNFGFSEAVVLTFDPDEPEGEWSAMAVAWDRTHGVSAEHEISGPDTAEKVVFAVLLFLAQQAENQARMEAAMEGAPGE